MSIFVLSFLEFVFSKLSRKYSRMLKCSKLMNKAVSSNQVVEGVVAGILVLSTFILSLLLILLKSSQKQKKYPKGKLPNYSSKVLALSNPSSSAQQLKITLLHSKVQDNKLQQHEKKIICVKEETSQLHFLVYYIFR